MIFNYHKYRKLFAALMLLSYIMLVSLSIFHYHHVDLQEGSLKIENGCAESAPNPFDRLIDFTHECTIQQFAHTVLDFNYIAIFNSVQNSGEQEFITKDIIQYPSYSHFNSNPFRAPPSFNLI